MPGPSLGTNLAGVVDWSTQYPFLDLMKMSRTWFTQTGDEWDTGEAGELVLDENGWITSFGTDPGFERVSTILFTSGERFLPSGRYVLDWEGEGELTLNGFGNWTIVEQGAGRMVIELPADADFATMVLSIESVDPNDHLRDIRFYHEDDAALIADGQIFTPEFLEKIQDFRSIRFMDWMGTNNSTRSEWSVDLDASDARWTDGHMPVEVMVALANQTRADAWFCIPHLATDEYIREFATYVRDNLAEGLVARFEYSNEVWNWGFEQAQWANAQAIAEWGDPEGGWMQWYGARAANMAEIVAEVFGEQTGMRALNVFSTQAGWQGLEQYALNSPASVAEGATAPRDAPFHVYAIAPYFSGGVGSDDPEMVARVNGWIAAGEQGFLDAIDWIRNGPSADSLANIATMIAYHAGVAEGLGWQLEAYEGGQHVVDQAGLFGGQPNEARDAFFVELVKRAEFFDLYIEYLNIWRDNGGGLLEQFSDVGEPGRYGSWGIWESIYSDNTSRAEAVEQFRDTVAAWWDDARAAGTFANGQVLRGRGENDVLTGGALSDWLYGNGGNDRLDGGAGDDLMRGGAGDDTYIVDSRNDRILEAVNGGIDTVLSSVSYDLRAIEIENATLTGTRAANLVGNALDNVLRGNAGNNILKGLGGADHMIGRAGNDTYVVADVGDRVTEAANAGQDLVMSTISWRLSAHVEDLSLIGTRQINGLGNELANSIVGNDRPNVIGGLGGADVMWGKGGADRFYFAAASDSGFRTYDRIMDLEAIDVIDLSAIDADTARDGDQVFRLVDALTGQAGQLTLTWVAASRFTVLAADVDGDGVADMRVVLYGRHDDFDNFRL